MRTVGIVELEKLLRLVKSARMVSLVALTDPAMRKTDNPHFGRIRKISRVGGVINFLYEHSVNRQRLRENQPTDSSGNVERFGAFPRRWGQRVKGTPLVEHVPEGVGCVRCYLEIKVQRRESKYVDRESMAPVQYEEIRQWLKYDERNIAEGVRQQVDRPVVLRDFRLDHIASIKGIDGGGETIDVRPTIYELKRYQRTAAELAARQSA